jgi:tetratricopeptide (TPR) repeat protein
MALQVKNEDPSSLQAMGVEAFGSGNLARAEEFLSAAIDADPTSERHYYRGVIRDINGNQESALKDLRIATQLDPLNANAFYSISIIYSQSNVADEAFEAARAAYGIDQNDSRIANHFARLSLEHSESAHYDPNLAVEVSRRACELTNWEDAVCVETHKEALAAIGQSFHMSREIAETTIESGTYTDFTLEVITHFEKRFRHNANKQSLKNIVPPSMMPVAVQTIESKTGQGYSIAFTTGLSNRALMVSREDVEFRFIELMMVIPAELIQSEVGDGDVWPWCSLQSLAYQAQKIGGFSGDPQVISAPIEDSQNGFVAFLTLPRLRGYVEKLKTRKGRTIRFISVMPIFEEEYSLACLKGVDVLVKRFQGDKIKPYYLPKRANVAK